MSDPFNYPLVDGPRADILSSYTVDALQPAEQDVTPLNDVSLSSTSSLASPRMGANPSEHRELHSAALPTPRHLGRPLMPRVRDKSNSHERAAPQSPLNRVTKQPTRYTCNECAKSYAHAKNLREHKAKHRNKRYPCEICGESVAEKRNLPRHKMLKHGIQHAFTTPSKRHVTLDPKNGSQTAKITKETKDYKYETVQDCNA